MVATMTESGGLAQLVALGRGVKGAAAARLVEQAAAAPGVFVFSELLSLPTLQALRDAPETAGHWDLLQLFAFGTYEDFVRQRATLPALSPPMIQKLRQLSLVSAASRSHRLPYAELLPLLGIAGVRELEDLIIDAVYKDLMKGKLDQENQCLEVEDALGRDVRPESLDEVAAVLSQWTGRCGEMACRLESEMAATDKRRTTALEERAKVEEEFNNLKKTIKVVGGSGPELDDCAEVSSSKDREPERKKEKSVRKGLRGSTARSSWKPS